MSFKTSRRAKSILASLLITSNFSNFKINAMESSNQQQNGPYWKTRGKRALKNEDNLLFEGDVATPEILDVALQNTVDYCQEVCDEAKKLGIKLLPASSDILFEQSGMTYCKFCYNKILKLSDAKRVLGCQVVSAHLMQQLTGIYYNNAEMGHSFVVDGKVRNQHSCTLVPCTDGQLWVLNVFNDSDTHKNFSYKMPLLEYADKHMAYCYNSHCCGFERGQSIPSIGLYIRVLLNSIINKYKDSYPNIINSTSTVDEIDQKGDFLLQPYIYSSCQNREEFNCKPETEYPGGISFLDFCFCLISDDDKPGDYSKYDMNVWNAAKSIGRIIYKKGHWENFLKLAEAFPQSKILIACPNAFNPKPGDPVIKLGDKRREAIKNLKADGKIFQKVFSLKEFLDINSKYNSELRELLESKNYNFS